MCRPALAVALLLATAPAANATEMTHEIKPDVRTVEPTGPGIREASVPAIAHAGTRSAEAATTRRKVDGYLILAAIIGAVTVFLLLMPLFMG
jgi:hypothetical protein